MIFESRKDNLFKWVVIGTVVLSLSSMVAVWNTSESLGLWGGIVFYGVTLGSTLLILSIWYYTYYEISEGELRWVCGPMRGAIKVDKITQVSNEKTMWVCMKMALAQNGMIIKYNRGSTIYISPERPDDFIARLRLDNPALEVVT